MSKKHKIWFLGFLAVAIVIGVFGVYRSRQKITYIEYTKLGNNCDDILEMHHNDYMIEQEFKMPYQMFQGIGLKVGTFGRENNTRYEVILIDKTTNQQLAKFDFNASQSADNKMQELMLNSPIKVQNTHLFSIRIKAKSPVNYENSIAFYVDKNIKGSEKLYYNGNLMEANLCMNLYGGDVNGFWTIFILGCETYVIGLMSYMLYLYFHKKSIKQNAIVQTGLLGIIVFAILAVFGRMETFSDEVDNIIGGMLIQKGHVLYRDYYTQHTPFVYFLCAIFSFLQAGSVIQFRFIYYAIIACIYMGLYVRHKDNFGKVKMAILPIFQIVFGILLAKETVMILSDNVQTIAMIALVLEFLQYLKDGELSGSRIVIVSISIFCGFCSAFVTVYAIFAICLGVLIKEILYWMKKSSISLKKVISRYWKLVIACSIPFIIWLIYLINTHSLIAFYQQAFLFNTKVYSYYLQDGFGSNIMQPFFIGITNFIQIIPNAIQNLMQAQNVIFAIVSIILGVILMITLLDMLQKKEYLKPFIIAIFISFSFTRTNEIFHSILPWSLIATIIVLYYDWQNAKIKKMQIILGIIIICMLGNYMNAASQYLFRKTEPISEMDQKIIAETVNGEEIFFDIYSHPSVYLIYKNRLPSNKLGFILPWYLDWYEFDIVQELSEKHPRVVVYDEDLKAWEIAGYDDYLRKYLHANYEQIPENKKIWISK